MINIGLMIKIVLTIHKILILKIGLIIHIGSMELQIDSIAFLLSNSASARCCYYKIH